MTSVTKVHLSVDTKNNLFLFFQILGLPSGDSDRSDKRLQSQERQGLRPCDKRKRRVTKGGALADGRTFVTRGFTDLLACIALLARLSGFCHFCHVTKREDVRTSIGGVKAPVSTTSRPDSPRSAQRREMNRGRGCAGRDTSFSNDRSSVDFCFRSLRFLTRAVYLKRLYKLRLI